MTPFLYLALSLDPLPGLPSVDVAEHWRWFNHAVANNLTAEASFRTHRREELKEAAAEARRLEYAWDCVYYARTAADPAERANHLRRLCELLDGERLAPCPRWLRRTD